MKGRRVGLRESTGELQPGMMVHTVAIGSCPGGTFPYQRAPVLTWSLRGFAYKKTREIDYNQDLEMIDEAVN